jgi:hypothetical protein
MSGGVCSIRIAVESRRTPHALATISSAIATETIGSTTGPAGRQDDHRGDEDARGAEQVCDHVS